jgi:hypothetical protein
MNELERVVQRLLRSGSCLPMTLGAFDRALDLERTLGLSPQDAIVLASVTSDAAARPLEEAKVFVSRNSKDFDDPAVRAELEQLGCLYISKFSDALSFTRSHRTTTSPPTY